MRRSACRGVGLRLLVATARAAAVSTISFASRSRRRGRVVAPGILVDRRSSGLLGLIETGALERRRQI